MSQHRRQQRHRKPQHYTGGKVASPHIWTARTRATLGEIAVMVAGTLSVIQFAHKESYAPWLYGVLMLACFARLFMQWPTRLIRWSIAVMSVVVVLFCIKWITDNAKSKPAAPQSSAAINSRTERQTASPSPSVSISPVADAATKPPGTFKSQPTAPPVAPLAIKFKDFRAVRPTSKSTEVQFSYLYNGSAEPDDCAISVRPLKADGSFVSAGQVGNTSIGEKGLWTSMVVTVPYPTSSLHDETVAFQLSVQCPNKADFGFQTFPYRRARR